MKDFSETFTKFRAHDIVKDGVDGRVDVKHHSGEVKEQVESLDVDDVEDVSLQSDDPQGQDFKWQHTCKEKYYYCSQHGNHLFS